MFKEDIWLTSVVTIHFLCKGHDYKQKFHLWCNVYIRIKITWAKREFSFFRRIQGLSVTIADIRRTFTGENSLQL